MATRPSAADHDHATCHAPRARHEEAAPATGGAARDVYTCPMHPEVRQRGPGSCPICGMALEPLEPAAAEESNPELIDLSRRLWIGAALALPVVVLEMGGHVIAAAAALSPLISNRLQLVL